MAEDTRSGEYIAASVVLERLRQLDTEIWNRSSEEPTMRRRIKEDEWALLQDLIQRSDHRISIWSELAPNTIRARVLYIGDPSEFTLAIYSAQLPLGKTHEDCLNSLSRASPFDDWDIPTGVG